MYGLTLINSEAVWPMSARFLGWKLPSLLRCNCIAGNCHVEAGLSHDRCFASWMAVGMLSAVTRSVFQDNSMQASIGSPRFRRVQVTNRLLRGNASGSLAPLCSGLRKRICFEGFAYPQPYHLVSCSEGSICSFMITRASRSRLRASTQPCAILRPLGGPPILLCIL